MPNIKRFIQSECFVTKKTNAAILRPNLSYK